MSLITITWRPSPKELRSFGAIFMVGFGIIGTAFCFWPWSWGINQNRTFGLICIGLGAVVGGAGLTGTKLALPFYWAWMGIAFVTGNVMSRILMGLFFYALITPMGFALRLVGHDRLGLRKRDTDSYWSEVKSSDDSSRYERQF